MPRPTRQNLASAVDGYSKKTAVIIPATMQLTLPSDQSLVARRAAFGLGANKLSAMPECAMG
jgi:hypothetical protein